MPNGTTKIYNGKVGVSWCDDKISVETTNEDIAFCRENAMDFARAIVQAVDESEKATKPKLTQLGPGAVIKWPDTVTFHRDFDFSDKWMTSRGDLYTTEAMLEGRGDGYEVLYKGLDT